MKRQFTVGNLPASIRGKVNALQGVGVRQRNWIIALFNLDNYKNNSITEIWPDLLKP